MRQFDVRAAHAVLLPAIADTTLTPPLEIVAAEVGRGLRELGVNVALGAVIKGIQAADVAATPKHFPGHRGITGVPMLDPEAAVPGGVGKLLVDLQPFAASSTPAATPAWSISASAVSPTFAGFLSPHC